MVFISKMEGIVIANQKMVKEKGSFWSNLVNSKLKLIVVSLIVLILLFNIISTLTKDNAGSSTLKEDLLKLEQRIAELEKRSAPDVEALRAEFDAVRKVGEGYEARLQALLKAEEEGLAAMKKELEAREAWLESLKKAVSGEK